MIKSIIQTNYEGLNVYREVIFNLSSSAVRWRYFTKAVFHVLGSGLTSIICCSVSGRSVDVHWTFAGQSVGGRLLVSRSVDVCWSVGRWTFAGQSVGGAESRIF